MASGVEVAQAQDQQSEITLFASEILFYSLPENTSVWIDLAWSVHDGKSKSSLSIKAQNILRDVRTMTTHGCTLSRLAKHMLT